MVQSLDMSENIDNREIDLRALYQAYKETFSGHQDDDKPNENPYSSKVDDAIDGVSGEVGGVI